MSKFAHHKYTWQKPFGSVRHSWELRGPEGAIHFHASLNEKYGDTCGLEFHHAVQQGDCAPSHLICPLIGGPCWHDGTSLYATEKLWPRIKSLCESGEHGEVFSILEWEYSQHFSGESTPAVGAKLAAIRSAVSP